MHHTRPVTASGVSIPDHTAGAADPASLARRVRTEAHRLGFHAVGMARADMALDQDIARYDAFVTAGMHGEMSWLSKHRDARERLDGDAVLRGAKSVVCLARRYQRSREQERSDPETARSIARYARGHDYHKFLRKRVRRLATFIRSLGSEEAKVHARPLCDDAPILERAWASRAGLGFVGKNGMLIVPGVGSLVLLGEVVTTLVLEPEPPMTERCGTCTRCLDACPTGAFAAPFVLDARRCISYLTIELRTAIPEDLRPSLGNAVIGCDICQDVCPWNRKSPTTALAAFQPRVANHNLDLPAEPEDGKEKGENGKQETASSGTLFAPELEWLASLTQQQFSATFRHSAVKRAKWRGLVRNACVALGNSNVSRDSPAYPRILALLEDLAAASDALIAEHAQWALSRLKN
jgi:epoxyqueuosine reductase